VLLVHKKLFQAKMGLFGKKNLKLFFFSFFSFFFKLEN
jgi:hypothetical protein